MLRRIFQKRQDRRPAKAERKIMEARRPIKAFGESDKICHDCGGTYSSRYLSCPRTALHTR